MAGKTTSIQEPSRVRRLCRAKASSANGTRYAQGKNWLRRKPKISEEVAVVALDRLPDTGEDHVAQVLVEEGGPVIEVAEDMPGQGDRERESHADP